MALLASLSKVTSFLFPEMGTHLQCLQLQNCPEFVQVRHLLSRRQEDEAAVVRPDLNQSLGLQRGERVANRRAADAERRGELFFGEDLAEPEFGVHDGAPDACTDLGRQGPGLARTRFHRIFHKFLQIRHANIQLTSTVTILRKAGKGNKQRLLFKAGSCRLPVG